jgi:hypothetical protein
MSAADLLQLLRADFSMDDMPQSGPVSDETLEALLDRSWMEGGRKQAAAATGEEERGGAKAGSSKAAASRRKARGAAADEAGPSIAGARGADGLAALPYPPSGVGYEVVQSIDGNVLSNVN